MEEEPDGAERNGEPLPPDEPTVAADLFGEPAVAPVPEPAPDYSDYEEPTVAAQVFAALGDDVDDVDDVEYQDDEEAVEDEEEDEDDKRKISFATKLLIVAGAWILLTLFLIGQFKTDNDGVDDALNLNQGSDTTIVDGVGEPVEGEVEEPVDTDGDGEIEEGEPGFATVGSIPGASAASGSGGGATSGGSTGGASGSGQSGSTGSTVAPAVGSSTTTTARSGGTTTTSTSTKGGPTSTSKPPTTTTTTSAGGTTTTLPEPLVRVGSGCSFDPTTLTVAAGDTVYFMNDSDATKVLKRQSGGAFADLNLAPDEIDSRQFTATTIIRCDKDQSADPTLTVIVN